MAYTYTKEIAEAGINHVVPEYAPFNEAYFYLQEATEADWNSMVRSIGIMELGIFEATGTEVVYEADGENIKGVKEKIAEFFKKRWEDIKGLYDKLITAVQKACTAAKERFKESKRLRLEELKTKDGADITFGEFHKYTGLDKVTSKDNFDFRAQSAETLRGEKITVTKSKLVSEPELWNKIFNAAFDFKFTKSGIIANYKATKTAFDNAVKAAKSAETVDQEAIKAAKEKVTNLNKYASLVCKLFHERQRLALGIVTKVAVRTMKKSNTEKEEAKLAKEQKKQEKEVLKNAGGKKEEKKEEGTKESAFVAESYSTEIERLFDWDF